MKIPRAHHRNRQFRRKPTQPESPDELFTSQAAKERRAAVDLAADFSNRNPVPNSRSKSPQRRAISRESPDVLQGDITIPPLPKPTTAKHGPNRQNPNNELSPSPSRKRSPSDIQPTDFLSSPISGSKRVKRSHKGPTRFDIEDLRFGPFKKRRRPGESLHFHVDLDQGTIELGKLTSTSNEELVATIELRRIIGAVFGESQCHKIRLRLARRSELPYDTVDIQFKTLAGKDRFQPFIQEQTDNIQVKSSAHMDNAFRHSESEQAKLSSMPKLPLIEASHPERIQQPSTRQKISAALQGNSEDLAEAKEMTDHVKRYVCLI